MLKAGRKRRPGIPAGRRPPPTTTNIIVADPVVKNQEMYVFSESGNPVALS
jgi:hypothetical protein